MAGLLKLTRAHTAPLEAVPATVGALLATGGSLTAGVFYWMVFGIGYHLVGYGHNSWTDWKNGYDKDDPNKQHHPLNTGDINPPWAGFGVFLGALALVAYTFILTPRSRLGAVMLLVTIGAVGAWMYNEKGKETHYKFVYIAAAHTTVFLIPYVAMGGVLTDTAVFGTLVMIYWVTYQILISGEIKDMQTDEVNFVRKHSVINSNGVRQPSDYVTVLGVLLRMLVGGFALMVAASMGADFLTHSAIIVLSVYSAYLSTHMITQQYNKREDAVSTMSKIEMLSLFIFLIAFTPLYGRIIPIVLMIGSVLWVVALNKSMWGTVLKPDV